jgi:hypothetical protein
MYATCRVESFNLIRLWWSGIVFASLLLIGSFSSFPASSPSSFGSSSSHSSPPSSSPASSYTAEILPSYSGNSPQSSILGLVPLTPPSPEPRRSRSFTAAMLVSSVLSTSPNTTCLPSSQVHGTVVMKNCDPFLEKDLCQRRKLKRIQ